MVDHVDPLLFISCQEVNAVGTYCLLPLHVVSLLEAFALHPMTPDHHSQHAKSIDHVVV